jgi:hypothetical protein
MVSETIISELWYSMFETCLKSDFNIISGVVPGVESCILRLNDFADVQRFIKIGSICSLGIGCATKIGISDVKFLDQDFVREEVQKTFKRPIGSPYKYYSHVLLIKRLNHISVADFLYLLGFSSKPQACMIQDILSGRERFGFSSVLDNCCHVSIDELENSDKINELFVGIASYVERFYGSSLSPNIVKRTYLANGGLYFGPYSD